MKYSISEINDVKFNLEHNNVNSVQRSRLHMMAHVIFIIYRPGARGIRRNISFSDDISEGFSPREISSLKEIFRPIPRAEGL